jgi:hypothetical protein
MTEETTDAAEPDLMDMFDADSDGDTQPDLVCRVCGSRVAAARDYPKAHWDWHEASNGA